MASTSSSSFSLVAWDSLKSLLYFPVWWYSRGLLRVVRGSFRTISSYNQLLGFTIWVKNIFTPLFGQYDFSGRLLSFFLRLANIIVRGIALFFISIVILSFVAIWLLAPLAILYWLIF